MPSLPMARIASGIDMATIRAVAERETPRPASQPRLIHCVTPKAIASPGTSGTSTRATVPRGTPASGGLYGRDNLLGRVREIIGGCDRQP